jgi:UDP-glucose 4-epimerase
LKIIITGALGHIGSYVVRDFAFHFPGAEIIMIDNLMTQRFSSLFNLPVNVKYNFIEADVSLVDLRPYFKNADVVIHLAAITDAAGSFDKAKLVEGNNFEATRNVAEACISTGAPLISLSSTSVYGTQADVVSEDCSVDELNPQSPYAETKLKEERMVALLCKTQGLKAVTCRFGTIFGPSAGMRFHTAVNKFCWQAVMGQSLTIWKTAYEQKRPYLDLRDASNALAFIIKNKLFNGSTYNILTNNSTVKEVVDVIRCKVPGLDINYVESKIMNQLSYEVSCMRFLSEGFIFSGDINRGIEQTLDLLKSSNSLG